jgi:phage terminase small subunit
MLSFRYRRFVAEYVKDLDAANAYLRAGYENANPGAAAQKLLNRPEVRAAIEARQKELAEQFVVTEERILDEFAKLAFSNMDDFIEDREDGFARLILSGADRRRRAALAQVTIEEHDGKNGRKVRRMSIRLASKEHALKSLARCLGLFVNKAVVDLTANLGADLTAARLRAWGDSKVPPCR